MFANLQARNFEILTLHHAEAILLHDMQQVEQELEGILGSLSISVEELVKGGGGESSVTQRLRGDLEKAGWTKHSFQIVKIVDGEQKEATTHTIDHVKRFEKGTIVLEIEWNNKDPFFDRDLENFKRLHADGAISLGIIITRGSSLQTSLPQWIEQFAIQNSIESKQDLKKWYRPTQRQTDEIERRVSKGRPFASAWAEVFVADKFGTATTHWDKLRERLDRGVGNPCPLLLIGIPQDVVHL